MFKFAKIFSGMVVYKFGGASVKDAEGIKNLAGIVKDFGPGLVVVVSALGKTTNALEEVARISLVKGEVLDAVIDRIWKFHENIIVKLFPEAGKVSDFLRDSFAWLGDYASGHDSKNYDYVYDQVVSLGEIWSTKIVYEYLISQGISCSWVDMRETLITDDRYMDANINWLESEKRIRSIVKSQEADVYIMQGFIGGTITGDSTTLGREGSDYTAGVVANMLDAERVDIWKDVPGILNADPNWMTDAIKLENISYKEAVEMSFSGAKVIHPKTIKPLQNKSIPLFVRSFIDPGQRGTVISSNVSSKQSVPVYVKKENQVLISLLPVDFSFVMGENLGKVFHLFYRYGIKTNLVQASAVSIAVCVDDERERIAKLTEELKDDFNILYNENVEMISLRYYTEEAVRKVTLGKKVLLEQRTRKAIRFVLKDDTIDTLPESPV